MTDLINGTDFIKGKSIKMESLNLTSVNETSKSKELSGEKISFVARFFGCWHFKMSRPMTVKKETYCVCTACGARIKFDTEKLTTVGSYYYPPQQALYPDN